MPLIQSIDATAALTPASISDPLTTLHGWAREGWLRRLDSSLAAFVRELDPNASPALLVSAAVLAQMEGRGHTCLPLSMLVTKPNEVLAWPESEQESLTNMWSNLPCNLADWIQALQSSPLVRKATVQTEQSEGLPETDRGQPLVLGGTEEEPLLYLRRYWIYERQVSKSILELTIANHPVDEPLARQWLDRLFPSTTNTADTNQDIDWQKIACAIAMRSSLTVITGGPGTGKTYTAARLLALLFAMHADPHRLRIALAAPTGKAAARLRQSIDVSLQELSTKLGTELDLQKFTKRIGAARTLHSLLGARTNTRQLKFNANNLLDIDILIVDEASMIHLEMTSALLQAMPPGAKLILLGDKDQLASVEAGAVLGDLCQNAELGNYTHDTAHYIQTVTGQTLPPEFLTSKPESSSLAQQTVMLRKSRRFGGKIGQLALAVNSGDSQKAQLLITQDTTGALYSPLQPTVASILDLAVNGRPHAPACYADYLQLVKDRPKNTTTDVGAHDQWVKSILIAFDRFRVLCAVHESDWGTSNLNQGIQQALANANLLKPRGEWFTGLPVMVTANDIELGVVNGDIGVTLPACRSSALRVYFLDGDSLRSVSVSRLAHVETAFAMTTHKSQGSEFLHTALVLPHGASKILTRELVYTGITRARENFTLFEAQPGLLQQAIKRKSHRASGLIVQLQTAKLKS